MSKLKLWKPFSLFMVLLLMSSLVAVVPARTVQASILQQSAQPTPLHQTAQLIVPLGSAAAFAVLAGSTVTNTGATTVNGDLGVSPGTAVPGFPPGSVNGETYTGVGSAAGQAKLDLTTAYNDAAGRTLAPVTVAGNIGGQTLAPGLYKSTSSLAISSGDLTLDAQGNADAVWIFQIASTLTTTSGRKVILSGGANAANIFWQVGTSATLGTTSVFQGNILADQSITMTTGATLNGRALARVGAVTLDSNIVTLPSMSTTIPPTPPNSITVNPYDTRFIGLNTGYRITMTTGASLNAGDTITIVFPSNTTVPDFSSTPGNVFVKGTPCVTVTVAGQQVTVTIPATAPIVPGQQFTVTFNKASGILNPTTFGFYNVTVWTSVEPTHITSSPYEITAVKLIHGVTTTGYATITAAIAVAVSGDTITVPAGTYNENLSVNIPLTLTGASSTTVIVTAPDPAASVFNVTANYVNISGFTVRGATGGGQAGIYLGAGVANSNISNNILTGNYDGIWLGDGSNHNTLTGNNASGNQQGFEVYHSTYNTFINNTANANGPNGNGFRLDSASNNTFTGNIANSNSYTSSNAVGFFLVKGTGAGSNDNTFTNNTANSNGQHGFRIDNSTGNTLIGNTANSNVVDGIKLKTNSNNTTLTGNNVSSNSIGIDVATGVDATTLTVSNNNIAGNTSYGVSNTGTGTLNAKFNYWGHASGPSYDGLSFGDSVSTSTFINFQPWLVSAYTGTPPVGGQIGITTTTLPDGTTGVYYPGPLSASGGTGSYTWSLYSGSLPGGLHIVGSNLTGTPTVVNMSGFNFALQANDGTQATYQNFTLIVSSGTIVITNTAPLPGGTKNMPYGPVTLQATGGSGGNAWSHTGDWPADLNLDSTSGTITGIPTEARTFNFNVRVVSGLQSGNKDFSLIISNPAGAGQKLIGVAADAASTGGGGGGSGAVILQRFPASATGPITEFRVKASASGNVKVAIYDDSAGSPGALRNAVNTSTPVSAGAWTSIPINSTSVTSGNYYWLAVVSDSANIYYSSDPSATVRYKSATYSSWTYPDPAGSGWSAQTGYTYFIAGWSTVIPSAPTVTNSTGESNLTPVSATLNGAITATGGENPTVIVYWGASDGHTTYTSWDHSVNLGTQVAGTFSTPITGLTPSTTYYYQCFASNSGGSNWVGSSDSFMTPATPALGAPTVTNSTGAGSITATSARLNGAITDTGGENPTVIVYWGDNDGATNAVSWDHSVNLGTQSASFSTGITDLNRGTTYYYRCFASNSGGSDWPDSSATFNTAAGGAGQLIGVAADAASTGGGGGGSGAVILQRFPASATGPITEFRVKASASGNVKVAIYDDSAGSPGALRNAVNTSTPVSAGAWTSIPITSTSVNSGTYYWLAVVGDSANIYYSSDPSATVRWKPSTYSSWTFPDPAGSGWNTQTGYTYFIAGWAAITLPAPPAPPAIVTPKTSVTFEWNASSGATKYRLQVNTASDFTGTSMFDAEVSTTSQDVKLTIGTTYYWRVKAGNTGGWSGWSSTGSVTP
ncbi:MAG: ice-binding family protein [Dehalococcoidia bacterium]